MALIRISLVIYYLLLLVSFIIGCKNVKSKSSDFFLVILLLFTLCSEVLADYFRKAFHNNMPVYHFFNPLQYLLIVLYYNFSLPLLKKMRIGLWLSGFGILLGIISTVYFQNIHEFPSVFLLFEAFCIIVLSMISYFVMFLKEDFEPTRYALFWFTSLMLFYWSFTFVIWGMISIFIKELPDDMKFVYPLLSIINFIYYGGIGIVFLNYKKLIPSGGQ